MSKNTNHNVEILRSIKLESVDAPSGKTQEYSIVVTTSNGRAFKREVLIEYADGVAHQLKTIANYLDFMAKAIVNKGGEK